MNYKTKAILEEAAKIHAEGFRVFIAKSGTHGAYTDQEGNRVTSFQYDLGGLRFFTNYITSSPRTTGTGWEALKGSYEDMNKEYPPHWAVKGASYKFTTLEQYLERYGPSSKLTEYTGEQQDEVEV